MLNYAALSETGTYYLKVILLINVYYVMGAAVNTTLIAGAVSYTHLTLPTTSRV